MKEKVERSGDGNDLSCRCDRHERESRDWVLGVEFVAKSGLMNASRSSRRRRDMMLLIFQ